MKVLKMCLWNILPFSLQCLIRTKNLSLLQIYTRVLITYQEAVNFVDEIFFFYAYLILHKKVNVNFSKDLN